MPRTMTQAEIVHPTGNFHHDVTDRVLPVANSVLDDATALHTAHGMLNAHFLARDPLIFFFLHRGEFTTSRFLRRLLHGDVRYRKALKSHILIEDTTRGQRIVLIID